jgi:hypothetical protein
VEVLLYGGDITWTMEENLHNFRPNLSTKWVMVEIVEIVEVLCLPHGSNLLEGFEPCW